jgi:hypothetical protein
LANELESSPAEAVGTKGALPSIADLIERFARKTARSACREDEKNDQSIPRGEARLVLA